MARHHRLIILGAGTAGLSAFKQAADFTDDIVMIDPGPLGTTCARVGCMPSKALLQIARETHAARRLHDDGLLPGRRGQVDRAKVMSRVRELRDGFTAGPIRAVERMGENYIAGAARFAGPDRVEVDGETLSADAIIVAAGTSPLVPDDWPDLGDKLITSDDIFELENLPERVGVIGAGAVGCEIGQALAMLGIEVHVLGRGDQVAGIVDPDISAAAREALGRHFHLHTGET
ncbi:MAG: FAD-dependent oxidoreductase, partial [Wenzhouxiangella sp.]